MMLSISSVLSRQFRLFGIALTAFFLLTASGCASFYVDSALPDIPAEKMKKVAQPKPVQVLFEFQTKGALNSIATNAIKPKVLEHVTSSQLFSNVSTDATAGGAVLSIVVNNVPLTDDAFSKGFATGLTFGLVGTNVSDGYVCTINYLGPENGQKITKLVRHAIHTSMGAASAPEKAIKADSIDAAVNTMLRQIINNGLYELSNDAGFR